MKKIPSFLVIALFLSLILIPEILLAKDSGKQVFFVQSYEPGDRKTRSGGHI